jgi:hypothetical protein
MNNKELLVRRLEGGELGSRVKGDGVPSWEGTTKLYSDTFFIYGIH